MNNSQDLSLGNQTFTNTNKDIDKANIRNFGSDIELWNLFKNGDEAAFAFIYRSYFAILYNYGTQFCTDREVVKDCIQDMFVELRLKRSKMIDTNAIKPFLFTLLRRRILKYLKIHNNKLTEIKEESAHLFPIEISPEQLLINTTLNEESIARLRKAINKLPVNEREIVFLFYFENYSYQQISDILGFKHVRSARNLLYKALTTLKKHVDNVVMLPLLALC